MRKDSWYWSKSNEAVQSLRWSYTNVKWHLSLLTLPSLSSFHRCCAPTVKPRSPKVWNVTLDQKSKQAIIYIQIPYRNEYLKAENQLFQILLRSPMNYTVWLCDFWCHSVLTVLQGCVDFLALLYHRFKTLHHQKKSSWKLAWIACKWALSTSSKCDQYRRWNPCKVAGVSGVNRTVLPHLLVSDSMVLERHINPHEDGIIKFSALSFFFFLRRGEADRNNVGDLRRDCVSHHYFVGDNQCSFILET